MSAPVDSDTVSEDDLPTNWIQTKSDAVQEVLGELTSVYNEEGDPIPVEYHEQSHADKDGEYVAINPLFWDEVDPPVSGPNILRVLDDILAHEVSHYNWSDLESKEAFGEMYEEWGDIPGHVANILEDEFVDARRMRKWYGMRSKRAYRVKLQADTERFTPDVSEVYEETGEMNAYLAALHQVGLYGTARGLEDAPDDLKEFCAYAEPVIERVRRQNDPNERFKLFHVMMQLLDRYVDRPEDFDSEEFEDGPAKTISGDPGDEDEEVPEDLEDALDGGEDGELDIPDAFEEMLEEMMEEMAEDGMLPPDFDSDEDEGMGGDGDSFPDEDEDGDAESGEDGDESVESETDESEDGDESGGDGDSDDAASVPVDVEMDADADDEIEVESGPDGELGAGDDEHHPDGPRPESDIEAEEAEHHIEPDEMAESELEAGIEERYEVRIDDIEKADERDRQRWASLIRDITEYDLDLEERKRERDDRIEKFRDKWTGYKSDRRSEKLKERAENAGVIRELKEGFEELVSREVPKPARRGTRIDPHNVARRASGDMTVTELFEEEQVIETGDRCVGFATDISGSMGSAIDELKIAGAAAAEATQIIGDEFVWEAFTDRSCPDDMTAPEGRLDLRVVTGPNEEFDWRHLDSFTSAANEPTAAGIRDCFKMMQETDANEYVMIVVTDGVALVEEDGTLSRHKNAPVEQAREAVNEVRAQGVDVIGLGIGGMDDRKMEETFGGNNYRLTDIDSLAGDILDLYREQMDTVKVSRR